MPLSVFDYGRDFVLDPKINAIPAAARVAVEQDRDALWDNPRNHGLPEWDWKGHDEVPWPNQKLTLLGGRLLVRFAVVTNYPHPAVISATDVGPALSDPGYVS